jgi:hypothetical protein
MTIMYCTRQQQQTTDNDDVCHVLKFTEKYGNAITENSEINICCTFIPKNVIITFF